MKLPTYQALSFTTNQSNMKPPTSTMWCPPVMNPSKYVNISPIIHIVIGVMFTNWTRFRTGAPPWKFELPKNAESNPQDPSDSAKVTMKTTSENVRVFNHRCSSIDNLCYGDTHQIKKKIFDEIVVL